MQELKFIRYVSGIYSIKHQIVARYRPQQRSRLEVTFLAIIVLLCSTKSGYATDNLTAPNTNNIVEIASASGDFETLLVAATASDLVPVLSGKGPLTIFAPTDDAFNALPAGTVAKLLEPKNKDKLARILAYHVVSARVDSAALSDNVMLQTVAGPQITFTAAEQGFIVEDAKIINTDINASNGIIHTIDRVLIPPELISRAEAINIIKTSITDGVPMFNYGNAKGTVQVYALAAQKLLDNANLTQQEKEVLSKALRKRPVGNEYQGLAWSLRYALDDVLESLQ